MYLFFFNDTATTEIYTLSLHDALPIFADRPVRRHRRRRRVVRCVRLDDQGDARPVVLGLVAAGRDRGARLVRERAGSRPGRSEEHTSELQSRQYLVCRLLLEKKTHTST